MIRVLFVDDDPDILVITKKYLEVNPEIWVDTALTANDALSLLQVRQYDAVISDYAMPGIGGSQFLRIVRKDFGDLPVIIFTGRDRSSVLIEVLNTGADFFLQKGADTRAQFTELESMLRQAVQRRRAEQALRESEQRFRLLAENAIDVIYRVRIFPVLVVDYISPSVQELTGYSPEEFSRRPELFFEMIYPGGRRSIKTMFRDKNALNGPLTLQWLAKDGKVIWVEQQNVPIHASDGSVIGLEGVARDISDRKQIEAELKRSLADREMLIREIHHRVKNNLQVISSLLYLGSSGVCDPKTLAMLEESRNRIRSIALIHEKLCRKDSITRINFADYIESFTTALRSTYGKKAAGVRFSIRIDPGIEFGIDEGIALGLIVNELVSNSLKYAFNGRDNPEVTIKMTKCEGDEYELSVADNGQGIDASVDIGVPGTLGLSLVKNLTEQIGGSLTLDRTSGTHFTVRFHAT